MTAISSARHPAGNDVIRSVPTALTRGVRIGQDVIAGVLGVIGTIRAIHDGTPWPWAVAAGACLLAWYGGGAHRSPLTRTASRARGWLLVLTALWCASVVLSEEFVWMAFLLWLLAGHLLGRWYSVVYAVAVFGVVVLAPIAHHGTTDYATVVGPLVGGVFAWGISRGYLRLLRDAAERERLVASLTATQQEMADLQDELALTQRHAGAVAERTRLARDIHDTVAQSMSSIRLLAHAAVEDAADERTRGALRQVEALAAEGLGDIRRIVAALVPAELEDGALASALTALLTRLRHDTGIATDLHLDRSIPPLAADVEVALLRVAQSALANVRLHSAAGSVVVSLVDDDDRVRLDIVDDGRGFDPSRQSGAGGEAGSGYGIGFMRSRLRELGGGLEVESAPGEGSAISAHLPIRAPAEGE